MAIPDEKETTSMTGTEVKVAALEAHQEEHEKRHERFESALDKSLEKIDKRLENGERRFDTIDGSLQSLTVQLTKHCNNNNHSNHSSPSPCAPANCPANQPKAKETSKEIIIRIGVPAISGAGLMAIILYLLAKALNIPYP